MTTTSEAPLPLDPGDHLTVEEFHRRYLTRPDIKRAELIDGVVYMTFAVGVDHSDPHALVVAWLTLYRIRHPGLRVSDNATFFMPGDNEVQPDAALFRLEPEGRVRIIPGEQRARYFSGIPDLVVEIAASSASYDLHSKKRMYERVGVSEYVAYQIYERRVDWFRRQDGVYQPVAPDASGVIESQVFPGLRLHVGKLLAGDDAGVLAELG